VTVLYLICARDGSKRLPGKNLKTINGISLVGYKCLAAKASKSCTDVMISTDSPQIAEEARQYGVFVPFMRPAELATHTATTEDVVRHAIAWWDERSMPFDAIHLLEPSSPFVRPFDYDLACEVMTIDTGVRFVCAQVLYLFRWDYLKTRTDLYDHPVGKVQLMLPDNYAVDIDRLEDLEHAVSLAPSLDLSWAKP
jgi:CMP-N-acetylneuraminic acid synthetase